jgi:hypothetical protein
MPFAGEARLGVRSRLGRPPPNMSCRGWACPAPGHPKGCPYRSREMFAERTRICDPALQTCSLRPGLVGGDF